MSDDATPSPLAVGSSVLFAPLLGFCRFAFLKVLLLFLRIVHRADMLDDLVKMRNILSNREAGQRPASLSIGLVCGDDTNNLNAVRLSRVEHRTATDAIDGDSINKVGISGGLTSGDIAGEEAQSVGLNTGEAEPSDLRADGEGRIHWAQWYRWLRKLQLRTRLEEDHSRIGLPIEVDDALSILQESDLVQASVLDAYRLLPVVGVSKNMGGGSDTPQRLISVVEIEKPRAVTAGSADSDYMRGNFRNDGIPLHRRRLIDGFVDRANASNQTPPPRA